jgi:hypothetical protein
MTPGKTRALGWLVLTHGVSHAMLTYRDWRMPVSIDAIPVTLCALATVGFLTAAIGLIGARRLDATIGPLLVLASGFSLVGIVQLGDPTAWFSGFCDAGLFALGVWRGYAGWPAHAG